MSDTNSETKITQHGQWSSRWMFVMAATGSAVGLGNIWKFPYMTGKSGGGAFVIVYLVCIALIGLPVLMAEISLGRRGRQSPVNAMKNLIAEAKASKYWVAIGWSGMLAGFLILSYYSVIAGWTLVYIFKTALGDFVGLPSDQIQGQFGVLVADPLQLIIWHSVFMLMVMIVLVRGVERGLEVAVRFLMPALLALLGLLLYYAITAADFQAGVDFMFKADFSKLTFGVFISAMGHAFFTLSLAMGAIMVYGAYLRKNISIATAAVPIVIADTAVAILAGLIIFPIVFANGLEPAAGPSLIFETLPVAFGQMPGGTFWGTIFFVLLAFAAWTSAISLIEPAVAWVVEKGVSRVSSVFLVGGLTWLVGLLTVFSFNELAFEFEFAGLPKSAGFFDAIDILTSIIMLPIGGILIAIFCGWIMPRAAIKEELELSGLIDRWWIASVCYVAPVGVSIVMIYLIFGN